jgi:N-acetylneuraminate lyase
MGDLKNQRLTGLIAATYTPMDAQGNLRLEVVPAMVDRLIGEGVSGLYICGSTGEGMSLSGRERREVAASFVAAANKRIPVIVQVGHNSLSEAAELAAHAQQIGADATSATAPSYFKVDSIEALGNCMADLAAAAPALPFYYYHIPALTGAALDMPEFLEVAGPKIENLAGIKYTKSTVFEYQACREFENGRYDILWGCDEMLLSALVVGAEGAVGSTYNIAAPLYRGVMDAFASGDLERARQLQMYSVQMVRTLCRYPFHSAMKVVLKTLESDCGRCRLPQPEIDDDTASAIRRDLESIGFYDWGRNYRV